MFLLAVRFLCLIKTFEVPELILLNNISITPLSDNILPTSEPADISASMIDLLSYLQIIRIPLQRPCEGFRFLKSMMGHLILSHSLCEDIV